jgi:hypothetical protein
MIPIGVIVTPFLVAFILFAFQYYKTNPERRVFNTRFLMMVSTVVLMLTYVCLHGDDTPRLALLFLLLSLTWLGTAVWMLRGLPPPQH